MCRGRGRRGDNLSRLGLRMGVGGVVKWWMGRLA